MSKGVKIKAISGESGSEKFECRVIKPDTPDQTKTLYLKADDKDEIIERLQKTGCRIVSIKHIQNNIKVFGIGIPASGGIGTFLSKLGSYNFGSFGGGVSTSELIFFAIQLATLLEAGIPLLRSLEVIKKGITNTNFQDVISGLSQSVSEGSALSAGIRNYPKIFPDVWEHLVEVGEATGRLPQVLREVSHYQESSERVKQKVISALFYPATLIVVATSAVAFLLTYIVPKFTEIFMSRNMALPAITKGVIALSNLIRFHAISVFIVIAGIVVGLIYAGKTTKGRFMMDKFILKIPVIGTFMIEIMAVKFSRSLSTLIKSGTPLLKGLDISAKLLNNKYVESELAEVREAVSAGQGLGLQLESKKVFPVFMTQILTVGEESGDLDQFLELISNYYESRVDTLVSRLTTLIEPIMLVVMGIIIGAIVISMFLPIIELSTSSAM